MSRKLSRRQLRGLINEEISRSLNEGTSLKSLKQLFDYLTQQGIKYDAIGAAQVAYEIGDELIEKITDGDIPGAADMFIQRYNAT
jgi:hypothetical protein